MRTACQSRVGQWLFNQFSVINSIDLRAVKNEDDVKEALLIAKDCDHLFTLTLYQSAVTDSHLEILRTGFSKLEQLKLNETQVTDAGIENLRDLQRLELLNLQRTGLTNDSVPMLASLPRLKELNIGETRIDEIQEIRDSNPRCLVNTTIVTRKRTTAFLRVNARRTK